MNRTFKIVKYQIHDSIRIMGIYYIIIVLIGLFMATITMNSTGTVDNFGGIGISSTVFLFAIALNSFRTNFLFMQANNLSRRNFYFSAAITWTVLAGLMAVLEVIFNQVFRIIIPYKGVFEQLYRKSFMFEDFMWCFALFVFTISIGWIITLIYYRCSKIMRVIVSLIPILILVLLGIIDNMLGGNVVGKAIVDFLSVILGFSDHYNAYRAVASFWIFAIGLYALSFLLVRRAPIK